MPWVQGLRSSLDIFRRFISALPRIEFSEEKPEEGVQHLSVLRGRDRDGKRIYLDVSVP